MTQQEIDELLRRNSELEAQTKHLGQVISEVQQLAVDTIIDATKRLKSDRRFGQNHETGRLEASATINGFIDTRIATQVRINPYIK
ncbi:MAG: hypothetical protein JJU41_13670 [Bacteroidetes bacterium]|nr:hypothetical protein [Bacteroidota bacterium]